MDRLSEWPLTKAELLMVFNLRPTDVTALSTIVEEAETRFDEKQQNEMLLVVKEVLGG